MAKPKKHPSMRITDNTPRAFATRKALTMLAVAATVLVVNRYANAVPGGETRNGLSFAGTLRSSSGAPVNSATTLTFTFRKGSASVCAPSVMVTPDSGGGFVAQIPTDGCPRSLFDGSDVTFDVANGGNVIAMNQVVNPVPYARYADQVGTPDCPATYTRDTSASGIVLCSRSNDEVVRVGSGNSAFWIDRYEARVFDSAGTQFGGTDVAYPNGCSSASIRGATYAAFLVATLGTIGSGPGRG